MESYDHHPTTNPEAETAAVTNLEAETAAVLNDTTTESETEMGTGTWTEMPYNWWYVYCGITEDDSYLWTEAEMHLAAGFIHFWENSTLVDDDDEEEEEEESEASLYEEMAVPVGQLKTGEFDERHEDEEICSVCLEDLYRGTGVALDCHHEFHVDCIWRWLLGGRNTCPLCRARARVSWRKKPHLLP